MSNLLPQLKVLVIDRHEAEVNVIKILLNKTGRSPFIIEWEYSVTNAIFRILKNPNEFDVYIINNDLGRLDGFAIVNTVKKKGIDIPVIMLLDGSEQEVLQDPLKLGVSAFLIKKVFNLKMLEKTIIKVSEVYKTTRSYVERKENQDCISDKTYKDLFEHVSLNPIIKNAHSFMSQKLNDAGIAFNCVPSSHLLKIECKPLDVTQIMVNLISNAIDAISNLPSKWISIEIEDVNDKVRIKVLDSGLGVPEHLREDVLNTVFTAKTSENSAGLGLAAAKKFAAQHGGTLYLDQGSFNTCFVVELPKRQDPSQENSTHSQEPLKILVADDEPEVISILVDIFRDTDCDVLTAKDGKEVLEILSQHSVDAIIADVIMPNLDGIEMLKQIPLDSRRSSVVAMMSGFEHINYGSFPDYAKPDHFIKKPFNPAELVEQIVLSAKEKRAAQ